MSASACSLLHNTGRASRSAACCTAQAEPHASLPHCRRNIATGQWPHTTCLRWRQRSAALTGEQRGSERALICNFICLAACHRHCLAWPAAHAAGLCIPTPGPIKTGKLPTACMAALLCLFVHPLGLQPLLCSSVLTLGLQWLSSISLWP